MTETWTPDVFHDALRSIMAFFDKLFFTVLQCVYEVFFNVSTAELFSNLTIREFYYR